MIVDGKKIAGEIKDSLKRDVLGLAQKPVLAIVKVGNDLVTEKFLNQKKKFASDIGVSVVVHEFPVDISTRQLREEVLKLASAEEISGVVIQLPLPQNIDADYITNVLPEEKDPDMLSQKSASLFVSGKSKILPPVAGAVKSIFTAYGIKLTEKNAVVVGAGKLVGKPVAAWLGNQGVSVAVVDEHTLDPRRFTLRADIIVSGVGKPNLVSAEMVKDGVVAIDCGTSESAGQISGDIDSRVAEKASIFTPVPGGVGPITVAMLFSNLIELAKMK
ncbi:MAG: bifunctional 5,10-methylenetetrahydrofolate dehydrogenase/5,10-methenyltetrahydrofolate cyclohydrolase [Patescibacteria group bacterium]